MAIPLKQRLTDALDDLKVKSPYRAKLERVVNKLNEAHIIDINAKQIPDFVQNLMLNMKGVLKNNPGDTKLKELVVECYLHPEKLQTKAAKVKSFKNK